MRQIGQRSEHLAGLVVVGVDGLFAEDDEAGLLFVHHFGKQFGHRQRFGALVGFNMNGAVGPQRQRGAQLLLGGLGAHGHGHDLGGHALLFPAHRLFHGNFAEGVHGHFDVGKIYIRVVRFDADFDVVVDDAFHRDEYFHRFLAWLVIEAVNLTRRRHLVAALKIHASV